MTRTKFLQALRRMRFEEAYSGWEERRLTREEAASDEGPPEMEVWILVNEHGERLVLDGAFLIYRNEAEARDGMKGAVRCCFERTTAITPAKVALRPWNHVWALVNEYGNLIADPVLSSASPLAIYSVDHRVRHVRNWMHRTDYSMILAIMKMMMEWVGPELR